MSDTCLLPQSAVVDPGAEARDRSMADLVGRAARSEPGAWDSLVARHESRVAAIARAHGLNEADVADVVQTVWLRLFEHIDRLRQPEHVGSWLAITTRNECMRLWRQRGKVTLLPDLGPLERVVDESASERQVETHDRDVQLRSVVATLPVRQQVLLGALMADPAPSYVQVANDLDIPIGSIGPSRQRCLRTLRGKCLSLSIGVA